MNQLLKILRSPDSVDVGDGGAPDSASTTAAMDATSDFEFGKPTESEQNFEGGDQAQPEKSDAKSDGQRLSELLKNKEGHLTDEDLALVEKYESGELDPEEPTTEEPKEQQQPKSDPVQDALKEVGAKSLEELASKIKELKRFIGSRDAQAYKQLEQQHHDLSKKAQNHQQWLKDLQSARPEAIEYLQTVLGQNKQILSQLPQGDFDQIIDEDEFISPDAGRKVNRIIGSLKNQVETLQQQLSEVYQSSQEASEFYRKQSREAMRNAARQDIKTELATIAGRPEFREYFLPKSGTVQELMDDYWKGHDGDPIDPRAKPLVEIFEKAKELGIDDYKKAFEIAARTIAFEKMQGKLLGAEQRGVQKIQNAKRSITPAASGTKTETNYTIEDVNAMVKGNKPIPSKWLDSYGDLDLNKIPAAIRAQLE